MFCQVLLYSKVNQPYIYTYLVVFGFPCHLKRCWENWTAVCKRLESEHSLTGAVSGQSPACQCRRRKRRGFNPWIRKIPWRRTWQSTPVFLPGVPHGWRCLVGYSPWGPKASNMTEVNERTCSQTSQRQRQTSSQWVLLLATHLSDNIRDAMCCRKPSWHLSMGGLLSELTCGFLDSLADFWTHFRISELPNSWSRFWISSRWTCCMVDTSIPPVSLAPVTSDLEDRFFPHRMGGGCFRVIQTHCIYCALYFYYYYTNSTAGHQAS